MSQSSLPSWLPIVLGGGGLIGASSLIFNLAKQAIDAKDARIKNLEERINELDKDFQRETQRVKNDYENRVNRLQQENDRLKRELDEIRQFRELLEENIEAIQAKGITDEVNSNLRRIRNYLNQWQSDEELLDSCRNAAQWVQRRQSSWLEEISNEAITKYPDQITSDQVERFRQDISNYLEWLYDSLFHGLLHEIKEYVDVPAINSPFPYRCAFRYLRQKEDIGDLTAKETEFFHEYLDELNNFFQ